MYSAENHDWDLTLRAAHDLVMLGQSLGHIPTKGKSSEVFSCFAGSMLLSFCAIESFSASVAFSMTNEDRFKDFDFEEYKTVSRFWDKIEMLCGAIEVEVDKSQGLFQKIREMQLWRNRVTHASPYDIPPTTVADTVEAPKRLHVPFQNKDYARITDVEHANVFYTTALNYIELIKTRSGIDPRASASYRIG